MNALRENSKNDYLRVTSIKFNNGRYVVFSGVPLKNDSFKVSSGRYFITVKADIAGLPVEPLKGQHWEVFGVCSFEELSVDGYIMRNHVYESPERIICSMPETGEEFIRFISEQSSFKGIGATKARQLWSIFGGDLYSLLRNDTLDNRKVFSTTLSETSVREIS